MADSGLQYRIVLWVLRLGLPLLAIMGGMVFAAHRGAMRLTEPLNWYGKVHVEELSFDLAGEVHAKSVNFRPHGMGTDYTIDAQDVTVVTPGITWLVRAGLAGDTPSAATTRRSQAIKRAGSELGKEPRALPPITSLTVQAESLRISQERVLPTDARWVGMSSASPFEALACADLRTFSPELLSEMGLPNGPLKGSFRFDAHQDHASVEVRVYAEGRGSTAWSADLRLADPSQLFDTDRERLSIAAEQWFVSDEGFVTARNRYCARRARLLRQSFVERHTQAVVQALADQRLGVTPEMVESYKHFAGRGGELTWQSRPRTPVPLTSLIGQSPDAATGTLEATLSSNGERPVPFRLSTLTDEQAATIAALANPEDAYDPLDTPEGTPVSATRPSTDDTQPIPGENRPAAGARPTTPVAATPVPATSAPSPAAPPSDAVTKGSPPAASVSPKPAATVARATVSAPPAPEPVEPEPAPPPPPPKPVPPVAKSTPLPASGPVSFDDLGRALGRTISVETRFGTRRTGKVVSFNKAAVTIEIQEKGSSLPLTVPRGTVRTIALVSTQSG